MCWLLRDTWRLPPFVGLLSVSRGKSTGQWGWHCCSVMSDDEDRLIDNDDSDDDEDDDDNSDDDDNDVVAVLTLIEDGMLENVTR